MTPAVSQDSAVAGPRPSVGPGSSSRDGERRIWLVRALVVLVTVTVAWAVHGIGLGLFADVASAFGVAVVVTSMGILSLDTVVGRDAAVISVIAAVVSGVMASGDLTLEVGVALLGAATLGLYEVAGIPKLRRRHGRRLISGFVSAAVVAFGVRLSLTGVDAVDALFTVVWVCGVTGAVRRLNSGTGLGPGLMAVAAMTIGALASFSGSTDVARLAATVAGTTVLFLAVAGGRGTSALGEAGSTCVGFLLAVGVLQADPTLEPMARVAVPLLVLTLPIANFAVVASGRLRHENRSEVHADLLERLVRRGLSTGGAVSVLIALQFALGSLAVLSGRAVVPIRLAFVILGHVTFATLALRLRPNRNYRLGRQLMLLGGALAVAVALAIPAWFAMLSARSPALAGAEQIQLAINAATAGDSPKAEVALSEAAALFADANARLRRPLTSLGLAVPVVSANLRAARALTNESHALTSDGQRLLEARSTELSVEGGGVSLPELSAVASDLNRSAARLDTSLRRVRAVDQPFLLPPVDRAVAEFQDRVERTLPQADQAAAAARLAGSLLGADGSRRYFLAIQNNAELRGTGGFIGSFGELIAEDGRLRLARLGRVDDLRSPFGSSGRLSLPVPEEVSRRYGQYGLDWKHVNMSPDFPTVAGIIAELYPQSGGAPVDGVISIDAVGLAGLLELVGPVTTTRWPEAVSAANAVRIVAHDSAALNSDDRSRFLSELTDATFQRFAHGDIGDVSSILRVLGEAASGRHVSAYFSRPAEQQLATDLGIAGAVPAVAGDSLLVVNNNATGNKADYYLTRRLRYQVRLEPKGDHARLRSVLETSFTNAAPSTGLSSGIIGPNDNRFRAGENVSLVSIHTPQALLPGTTLGGERTEMNSDRELGRLAHSTFLRLGSGETGVLTLRLVGEVALLPGGWYRLELVRQPVLQTDEVDVQIDVAPGWRIVDTVGLQSTSARSATVRGQVDRGLVLGVRLERTGPARFVDRLRRPPSGDTGRRNMDMRLRQWDDASNREALAGRR